MRHRLNADSLSPHQVERSRETQTPRIGSVRIKSSAPVRHRVNADWLSPAQVERSRETQTQRGLPQSVSSRAQPLDTDTSGYLARATSPLGQLHPAPAHPTGRRRRLDRGLHAGPTWCREEEPRPAIPPSCAHALSEHPTATSSAPRSPPRRQHDVTRRRASDHNRPAGAEASHTSGATASTQRSGRRGRPASPRRTDLAYRPCSSITVDVRRRARRWCRFHWQRPTRSSKNHTETCTRICRIWRAAVDSCHYVARPRGSVIGKKKVLPRSPAAPGSPRAGLRVAVLDDPRPLCGVRVQVSRVDPGSARLRFTWNTPTRRRTPTGVPGSPCRRGGHRGAPSRSMHGQKRTSAEGGATATQETHGPGMGG